MTTHETIPRYPLAWPVGWRRAPSRTVAPFSTKGPTGQSTRLTVSQAVTRLETEFERLGARDPTLSTNVQLRLDGRPRSDIEPRDPGVAVYFSFKGKATVFACDRYTRVADNIAAIAAHIEALRLIQRHGVGSIEQAMAGYRALPADTAADWRLVLGFPAGSKPTVEQVDTAFKALTRQYHHDLAGNEDVQSQLNRARDFALDELLARS